MKKQILILLLCCGGMALALVALVILFTYFGNRPYPPLSKPPEHGTEFLVQADEFLVPSDSSQIRDTNVFASLTQALIRQALNARFSAMGMSAFIESLPSSQLQIDLQITNNDETASISNVIVRRGFLEFRIVHDNSDEIIKNHEPIPAGYEVLQSIEVMPGQQTPERFVVKKQAEDGLADNLVQSALVASGNFGPEIDFTLNKVASVRFARVTTKYAPNPTTGGRHRMAIIIDGDLYSAPMITDPITCGECMITGHFTDEQAQQLAQILNHPLPVPVRLLEIKSF